VTRSIIRRVDESEATKGPTPVEQRPVRLSPSHTKNLAVEDRCDFVGGIVRFGFGAGLNGR
jgi:hypothetical protein